MVYEVFPDGLLKLLRNGNCSFKVEIPPGRNIGSYHAIEGYKVTLHYPGQQQTCARCHLTAKDCKGKAIARRCDQEGGA